MPRVSPSIWAVFEGHGILPPAANEPLPGADPATIGNLLPVLIGAWERAIADTNRSTPRRHGPSMLARLRQSLDGGAFLTLGVPEAEPLVEDFIGQRLIWWPRGVPAGERVAVISSRLGRWGQLPPHWFVTLRGVLEEVDPARQTLVTARETALAELIERWADARRVPLLMFDVAKPRQSLRRWWTECLRRAIGLKAEMPWQFPAWVSPRLLDSQSALISVRDAVLMAASDQVVVCQVRPHGNVCRLLEQRLACEVPSARGTTTVLTGPGFTRDQAADSLRRRGARVQAVFAGEATPNPVPQGRGERGTQCGDEAELIFAPPAYPCLVHCTRAIDGPWPDQVRSDYLDALLCGDADSLRTSLATLMRIIRQQTLLATGRAIRGRFPVVCFSSVPLAELPALRTFRAHRSRWDFEPYGIAIRRDWLMARGARPVIYGDDSVWESMDAAERPYFQRRFSGSGTAIDWSVEQEWRHVGTLDLYALPSESAFVFVPTAAAATALRPLSRWPVLVLSAS